jgi:hypothetical protein
MFLRSGLPCLIREYASFAFCRAFPPWSGSRKVLSQSRDRADRAATSCANRAHARSAADLLLQHAHRPVAVVSLPPQHESAPSWQVISLACQPDLSKFAFATLFEHFFTLFRPRLRQRRYSNAPSTVSPSRPSPIEAARGHAETTLSIDLVPLNCRQRLFCEIPRSWQPLLQRCHHRPPWAGRTTTVATSPAH